jgi:signal transduction histidine kinase/ligand-binding sensor domain-containing protein/DNA-binding response OmpR family regulator
LEQQKKTKRAMNDSRSITKYILAVLLFLDLFNSGMTQNNYKINVINSSRGLPSDDVKDVFQDSEGFLWFCTTEGLIRYDGYFLKIFSIAQYHDKGLITNSFNAIQEDSKGNLWCATDRGIARLTRKAETFVFYNTQSPAPFTLNYDVINTLDIDHEDHIWIGTSGAGVEVLSQENGIIESYNLHTENSGMNSDWITHIFCDDQANIWICSWQGTLTLINKQKGFIKSWGKDEISLNIPYFSPFSMVQSKKNEYWLGLWDGGLANFRLQGDSLLIKKHIYDNQKQSMPGGNIIYDLTLDQDSNLWIGTEKGLVLMQHPESKTPVYNKFANDIPQRKISHNEAFALFCDASGLIWAGTSGGGVNKIDNKIKLFTSYKIPLTSAAPQSQSQSVSAFTKTPSGKLLVGIRSKGFGEYDLNSRSFTSYLQMPEFSKLPNEINTVNCFYRDSKGNLWLGTRYMGLIKLDTKTGRYIIINKSTNEYDFASREIFDIQEDHLGFLWIGTENGLYKIVPFKPDNFYNFSVLRYSHEPDNTNSLSSNRISNILEDSQHNLWVATFDHGINRLTSNIKIHYPLAFEAFLAKDKNQNGLITDNIITLFEDSEGNLWIGSGGGGLFKWLPKEKRFISYNNYVAGTIIYNIEQGTDNNLWVATNRGLTRINKSGSQIKSNYFLQENGLQSNIFNKGASFKDSSGNLFFGGNNGFNYFDPLSIKPDSFIPPIVITDVKVMGETVQPSTSSDSPLVLNHLKNNFSVTFSALSFSQPENNKYSVCLEGLEKKWRILNADMRTLNYANLKPGNYTLKIKGSNSQGHWNPVPEKLYIKVNPAPYKTWWAFSLYAVLFGGVIFLFFKMEQKNQQVKHALQIEHIERQKSEKLNYFKQGLFANISHEFLTPLSILSCLIDDWRHLRGAPNSKDISLAERNINRLNRLNRQFLYYSKTEVEKLPLDVSAGNLKKFIQNICDNFTPLAKKNYILYNFEIHCPESDLWFDHEKMDIILYNLLSNAFKFTPKEGTISLSLSLFKSGNQTLARITIKDSGIGMDEQQQEKIFNIYQSFKSRNNKEGGFGIGLSLTKSMIEAHKGSISLKSTFEKGTTVEFALPVNKNSFTKSEIGNNNYEHYSSVLLQTDDIEEETILRLKNLNRSHGDNPIVLLVENSSDFRKLLKSNLEPLFSVIEAPNGVAGYEMAINKNPNIIISDVLMPAMNGIELCKKIKSNQAVTHIPVIFLTAKTSDTERAEGYRAGADSYITKPFNLNTLLARMEALLEQQKRVEERIKEQKNPINGHSHSAQDETFLINARNVIEENLSNPDFTVKMMAKKLSMSNSMLYRKISERLDINPNTFIRKMRMMKAAELLEEDNLTISEVASLCGFKDVSYFGVTFKKDYGFTPSQYQKKYRNP